MKDIKKPFLKSIISLALVVALVVGAVPIDGIVVPAYAASEETKTFDFYTGQKSTDYTTLSLIDPADNELKPVIIVTDTQIGWISSWSSNTNFAPGNISNRTGVDGFGVDYADAEFIISPNVDGKVTKIEFTNAARKLAYSEDGASFVSEFSLKITGMKYNGTDDALTGVGGDNEKNNFVFKSIDEGGISGNLSLILGPNSLFKFQQGSKMIITYVPDEAPTHTHEFSFNATGNTLTATCAHNDGLACSLADSGYKTTLTLNANGGYYGEHVFHGASHNLSSFNARTGLNATADTIVYTNKSTEETSTDLVSAVGSYSAKLVVHINGIDYTLTKDFDVLSDSRINNIYPQINISTAEFPETNHAREGETVTLTFASIYGESVTELIVTGATTNLSIGNGITDNENNTYKFTMPAEEVTISAVFDRYKITIDDSIEHGSVTATVGTTENATSAQVGDTVTIIAAPEVGYSLTALTYTPTGNDSVDILSTKSFTMPVNNVAVTATFELIPHTHNFTYSATDAVITATCANTDGNCPLEDNKAILTIEAPLHTTYGDGNEAAAGITDVNGIKGEAKVHYQQKNGTSYGTAMESAPTDAGDYMASITLGTATASVEYTIAKAESTANPPTASATFGQTLSNVELTNPAGNTEGIWTWVNDGTTNVGSVGNNTFKANFTPSDSNYSDKNNVDVVITVSKAAAQTITDVTQNLLYTETSVSASVAGKMPEDAGTLTYTAGAANTTGSVTVSNFTVDTSGNVTATISGGASGDTITLPVTISSTNYADASVNVNITLIAKNTQTITASDVTATYGDTGKSISANVTEPATGGGTLSYAVKSGSENYIGVDDDGKLTIKAVPPTDGKAYVTVTAAETADYAAATKDVTVTIGKATLTVAAKDQSIYVGDTVPSLSEPVLNKHYIVTGLVGEDTLTTAPTLEYKKEGSTVTPNNTTAGTYDIVPSGASEGNNYNISYQNGSLTISAKDSAAVTKVPKAKTLTYNGSAQELVTAGEADGGEMYYALGTETEATETYSTSIPTGTEVKTYYVWYKAIGDGSHSDTEPKAIAVTIGEEIIIRYDSNSGSGSMKDQKIEKGVETELKTNTFTRENYSFKEWNTKSDGSGDSYKDKAKVTLNNGMTLYAQWTKVEVHNHTFEKVDAVEPGCETDGNKAYYRCTGEGCDKWFEDETGVVPITDKSSVILKATGHKWDNGEVTKEATYDETGIRTFTCENDPSHTKEEEIPRKTRAEENYVRDSDTDDSDDDSGSSSESGSSKNSSESSKNAASQAAVDAINNVTTVGNVNPVVNGTSFQIPENHQVESGLPVSDIGGSWGSDTDKWTYTKSDGTLARGEWMNLEYNGLRYWYYFDNDSTMHTSWFDYNNERFYLMPQHDGWGGRMATGWKQIEGKWYYFETTPGSLQGRMFKGTVTPDGHIVGADGAWNGIGITPVGQE